MCWEYLFSQWVVEKSSNIFVSLGWKVHSFVVRKMNFTNWFFFYNVLFEGQPLRMQFCSTENQITCFCCFLTSTCLLSINYCYRNPDNRTNFSVSLSINFGLIIDKFWSFFASKRGLSGKNRQFFSLFGQYGNTIFGGEPFLPASQNAGNRIGLEPVIFYNNFKICRALQKEEHMKCNSDLVPQFGTLI
jgi:hypothetical protein